MTPWILHIAVNAIVLPILTVVYGVLVLLNPKVREKFLSVRRSLDALHPHDSTLRTIWFHAASMGEFEQAKPVIEQLRHRKDTRVIVSFSSPSGYTTQRTYAFADAVIYLPFDQLRRMRRLVQRIRPDVFVCIRYDLWWNLLWTLGHAGVPVILLNATYTRSGILASWPLRIFYHHLLSMCTLVVTANSRETARFQEARIQAEIQTGSDTRYDRICRAVDTPEKKEHWFTEFASNNSLVLTLGSAWESDVAGIGVSDEWLANNPDVILIIAPHEVHESSLQRWEELFPNCLRLTELRSLSKRSPEGSREHTSEAVSHAVHTHCILVDTMGELLSLYRYSNLAFIGGGFGAGVHSVAEAAAYGIPVACGPNTRNSPDVHLLEPHTGCRILFNSEHFNTWIHSMRNSQERDALGALNAQAIRVAGGSAQMAANRIEGFL